MNMTLYGAVIGLLVGMISGVFMLWLVTPYFFFGLGVSLMAVWSRNKRGWALGIACMCAALGWSHAHAGMARWHDRESFAFFVSGTANVVEEPGRNKNSQEVTVSFVKCEQVCPSARVLMRFPAYESFHYGDVITATCQLHLPENVREDFDYRMYLAARGIGFTCYPKSWGLVSKDGGLSLLKIAAFIRQKLERNIEAVIPEPEAGLGQGLLFGGNDRLTDEMQERFSRTGMSHIVAVSGSNVAIVAQYVFLVSIFCGLWRRQAFWVALVAIGFFVVMTGASASAVRAGIMGSLVLFSFHTGRLSWGVYLCLLTATLMLWVQPLLVRYDLGFILSFAATLGIMVGVPAMQSYFAFPRGYFTEKISEVIFMTVAAEIAVLPIIVTVFHNFSTLSLVANILVLPLVPFAMLFGFLAALSGFISHSLALVFGWLDYMILHYELSVIRWLSEIKFASIHTETSSVSLWWWLAWYGIFFFLFVSREKRVRALN